MWLCVHPAWQITKNLLLVLYVHSEQLTRENIIASLSEAPLDNLDS